MTINNPVNTSPVDASPVDVSPVDVSIDISIIVPVFKEEKRVAQMLERLEKQVFVGQVEVIVVDGHPLGKTIRKIRDCRIGNWEIKRLLSSRGRGRQMNAGAKKAAGRFFLFLHCDTVLPEGALEAIKGVLQDPSIAAGAFDLSISAPGAVFRMIEKTASLRSRLSRVPYGDQAIFIRKTFFEALNGYAPIPIMEDVDLMRRIKKKGGRIRILPQQVSTSARRWKKEGVIYGTLRNWTLITLYLCGVPPHSLVKLYRS